MSPGPNEFTSELYQNVKEGEATLLNFFCQKTVKEINSTHEVLIPKLNKETTKKRW